MKREEFVGSVADMIRIYIDNSGSFDSNAQLRVNPSTLDATIVNGSDMLAELEDSNEAVEDAAASEGAASEDATDFQVTQNPEFYSVCRLICKCSGKAEPDMKAIDRVAANYFKS